MDKFMQDLKQVYNRLEDEQSKSVFMNRLGYSVTNDLEYIRKIVEESLPKLPKRGGVYRKGGFPEFYKVLAQVPPNQRIVIYGAGFFGNEVAKALAHRSEVVFCDRNERLQRDGVKGIKVIAPDKLTAEYPDAYVVVAALFYCDEIYDFLLVNNFSESNILLLADYYMQSSPDQYFDPAIVSFKESEVFIDCGCLNFLSSKALLERCNTVKKIYAFEPNPKEYAVCEARRREYAGKTEIQLYPYGVWRGRERMKFSDNGAVSRISEEGENVIETVALDEVIEGEVTFIKMDIEGAEYEGLKGAERIIKQYKPKLAICVYHKPEDIIAIPLLINSMVSEYKLFMRHYSNDRTETVLYAICDINK